MRLDDYTLGKKYGKALFELAKEQNTLNSIFEELIEVQKVFQQVEDLGKILSDMRLSAQEKIMIVEQLKVNATPLMQNFLSVLFEVKRMEALDFIVADFIVRYNEEKGIVYGVVTSAVALTSEQKKQISKGMAKRLGIEGMELEEKIDVSIIGGIIVEANHQIIDGSIKKQLMKLKNLLKEK